MAKFSAGAGYELIRGRAAAALAAMLTDERLGYAWIFQQEQLDVGYLVLTLKYAMEYGGLVACLDDLYVKLASRNQGLSTAALLDVRHFCETAGIRAVKVEVGHSNGPAQTVNRRVGFAEPADRQLLTLALAAPAHVL